MKHITLAVACRRDESRHLRSRNHVLQHRLPIETFAAANGKLFMSGFAHWTEILRCPNCGLTGVADLSHPKGDEMPTVIDNLPIGFKPVSSQYGDTFFCEDCNRPATELTR